MNFKKIIPILSLFILLTLTIGIVSAADTNDFETDMDLSLNNEDFNVDCTSECNDYNTDDNIQNDINLTDNNDLDLSQDSKDTDKELKSSNLASTIVFTENDYSTYFTKGNLIPSSLNPGDTLDFSGTFTNKDFIINVPLTLTSSSNAHLVDCSITFSKGSDGSVISKLNINTTRSNTPVLSINDVTNVSIIDNNIFSSGSKSYGMALQNVSNSNILFNTVRTTALKDGYGHPSGMVLISSSYNNISSNNVIVNDSNGIYLSGYGSGGTMLNLPNSYNYIFNNTVHSVRGVEWELDEDGKTPLPSSFCYAMQIMGSNNQILNNTVYNAYRGISATQAGNNISGNIVHDIKGTWYSGDTKEEGGDYAIYASVNSIVKDNIVYNCHIKPGNSAVFLGGGSLFYNNSIINIDGNGSFLSQSNINFTNNTLDNISNYGVYVQGAYTNITISNNFVNSTGYSVALLKSSKTKYPFDIVIDSNKLYTEKNTAIYYEENYIGNVVITNNEGDVDNVNVTRDRNTVTNVTVNPTTANVNSTVIIKPSVTYMGLAVKGTVDIYINGEKEITVDIGSTYEFKPSHAGQFNVTAAFMDDGYYNASVSKAVLLKVLGTTQTTVSLNATNVIVNDSVLITPSVSSDGQIIEGTVDILVNGVKETSVAIGSAYVFVPGYEGSYNISARFTATDIYSASLSDVVVLTVNPLEPTGLNSTVTTVVLNATNVTVNDSVLITPSVSSNGVIIDGKVDILINGFKVDSVDIGSSYEFIPKVDGTYHISAGFEVTELYNSSVSDVLLLTVNPKDNGTDLNATVTTISLNATNVTVNDSVLITPSVSSNGVMIDGTVDILVDGVKVASVDIGSGYEFKSSVAGQFNISVAFEATDVYNSSVSDVVVLTVNPLNDTNGTGNDTNTSGLNSTVTTINLNETNVTVNDSVLITPSVSSNGVIIEGVVDILIDGVKVASVAIGSGYEFIPTVEGIYNISAGFEATEVYNSSVSEIRVLTVNPINDTHDTNFIVLSDDNYFDYFDSDGISTVLSPSGNYIIEIDEINNKNIQILSGFNITIRAKEGSGIINNGTIFVNGIDDDVESVIISGLTFNNTDDTAIEIGEYVSDINLTKNNIFVDGGSKSTGAYYSVYGINANGFITSMNIEDNNVTVVGTASYAYAIQLGAYDASSNPRDVIIKNNVIVMNGTAKSGMIEGIYLDCVINALVWNNTVDLYSINDVYVYGIQIADSSYLSIAEGNTDIMSPHNILITSNNFTLNSEYMVYGITVLDYGCDSSVNEYGQANRNMLDLNTTICDNIIEAYSNRGLLGIVGNTYNMSVFGNNVTAFAGSSEGVASNDVLGVGTYVLGVQYNAPLSAGYRVSVKDNTLITNITAEYINNHIFDELVDFENNKVLLDLAIAGNIGNLTNDTVNVGQTIEYNFTVSNYGPSKAFDVSVVFEFNNLIVFIESKLDGVEINSSSLNSSAILLNIGDLDANESMNLILTFRVVSNGTIENAVYVNSSGFDTNESNNELFISVLSVKAPYGSKDLQDIIDSAPESSVLDLSNYMFYEVSNIIIDKDITISGGTIEAKAGETVFIIVPKSNEGPNEVNITGVNFVVKNANTIVLATADNGSDINRIDVAAINFVQNIVELADDNVVAESVTVLELDSERGILAPTNNIAVMDNTLPSGTDPFNFEVTAFENGTNVLISEGGNIPEKLETVIILENMTTFAYQSSVDGDIGDYFYASLQDVNGNPLANKTVKVGLNGRVYTRTTNATGGIGVLMKTAISGRYTFAVSFLGDDNYNASFAVALCTVNKQTPKLSTSSKTYKASAKTKTISATLKTNAGNPLKGKTIKFTINGKIYSATSDSKGVASVKVSLSKKGSYSFTVKYAGDDTYASVSKKATLKLT